MKKTVCWQVTLIYFLMAFTASGQSNHPPSDSFIKLTKWFDRQIGIENNGLYVGPIYLMTSSSRFTHQFFPTKFWQDGTVQVEDQAYYDVSMVFDVEKELLIIRHPDISRRDGISIDMNKVVSFKIDDRLFKRYNTGEGLYELLYAGNNLDFIVKRKKVEKAREEGTEHEVKDAYYLYVADEIIPLKKNTLSMLHPNAKEISKKITKVHKVKLKLDDEEKSLAFLTFFDKEINE